MLDNIVFLVVSVEKVNLKYSNNGIVVLFLYKGFNIIKIIIYKLKWG